jgi:transcriptional regulator with XRE-family HTH domain
MGDEVRRMLKFAQSLGLSQAELAKRAGESQQVVNNWKRRGAIPGRKLVKVARALEVTVEELVTGKRPGAGQGAREDPGSYDPETLRVARAIESLPPDSRGALQKVVDSFVKSAPWDGEVERRRGGKEGRG